MDLLCLFKALHETAGQGVMMVVFEPPVQGRGLLKNEAYPPGLFDL
ncbi:hypothetical protein [Methylobacterium gregans]|nr:hypothetical protein [Methylobacterium gregans]MDQ0521360.1 hypothetical protein [Methylobacterium gregans]